MFGFDSALDQANHGGKGALIQAAVQVVAYFEGEVECFYDFLLTIFPLTSRKLIHLFELL